jgi:hypothetical protein
MTESAPQTPPEAPIDPESFEQQTKDLEKLTKNFYAALNELLPAAIRASKRGKHGLLRLISRKLPRPKSPLAEDPGDDRTQDEDVAAIAESVRLVFERPPEVPKPEEKKGEEKKEEQPPKAKLIPPPAPSPVAPQSRSSSGAPRSLNEEPWPGQADFPRPLHRRLTKRPLNSSGR